ncbi:hypothetical protein DYB26_010332 [Aphanomyces astaci]|uniref:DDE-1 domain-containing protein n=1 Tax=Aphanomyces astaci TaxID=112090 RepID=A0A3R7CPF8_APHAT|nr:hypothetical protein DYB26_010332 [Aphanomyces astaci]
MSVSSRKCDGSLSAGIGNEAPSASNSSFDIQAVFSVVSLDLLHPFLAAEVSRLVLGAVLTAVTIPLWLLETALCYTKAIALCYTKAIVVGLRCTSKAQLTGTESVQTLYDSMNDVIRDHQLTADRVFNMDETSIASRRKSKDVVTLKGSRTAWAKTIALNFHLSIVACGSADVTLLPPVFLLPGDTVERVLMHENRPCTRFLGGDCAGSTEYDAFRCKRSARL